MSAIVPGTREMSWLDQKAISLLNANLFVCPFSSPLCVPRLHIWSYHDRLWEKRNPLFSTKMEEKKMGWCWGCKSTHETGQEPAFGSPERHSLIRFIFHFMAVDMLVAHKLQLRFSGQVTGLQIRK